jgi:NADPH-dependent 2,4-dienoyl-CoA reductase/sulfur reductase-like enzyme
VALGVRLTANEYVEEGLHPAETAEIAQAVENDVDFINASLGGYWRAHTMNAPMDEPYGYQLEQTAVITRAVSVPTIVTGRVMTIDMADHIVESGIADMVSMVRAQIADPELVKKTQEGRTAEIRPCIGALECVSSTLGGVFHCTVNPSAGHELDRPAIRPLTSPLANPRKVLVVGGGPAGMEAARTAALRGHEVVLYEMRRELGGQAIAAAQAPKRSDFAAITHWQAQELKRLDVTVKLNAAVDPDVVYKINPDVLIVATGSTPTSDGRQTARPGVLEGMNLPHVYSSWDLFGRGRRPEVGARAVVLDDLGEFEPLSVADELTSNGVEVIYVTPFDGLGQRLAARENTIEPTLRRLSAAGIQLLTRSHLTRITPDCVELDCGGRARSIQADSVFFVGIKDASRELADNIPDFEGTVSVVGDAAGYHTLARAIHDGDQAGRGV